MNRFVDCAFDYTSYIIMTRLYPFILYLAKIDRWMNYYPPNHYNMKTIIRSFTCRVHRRPHKIAIVRCKNHQPNDRMLQISRYVACGPHEDSVHERSQIKLNKQTMFILWHQTSTHFAAVEGTQNEPQIQAKARWKVRTTHSGVEFMHYSWSDAKMNIVADIIYTFDELVVVLLPQYRIVVATSAAV